MKMKTSSKPGKEEEKPLQEAIRPYFTSFSAAYASGLAVELFAAFRENQFNPQRLTHHSIRNNCWISGVKQVTKDFSSSFLKRNPRMRNMSITNPFVFGAATGLPMWAMTCLFTTPLQNYYRNEQKPYKGYLKNFANEIGYHTLKNGLDEFCAAKVIPRLAADISDPFAVNLVEGAFAGIIGGSAFILAWPSKTVLTGQPLLEALRLSAKNAPNIGLKKIVYNVLKPQFAKYIEK